MDDLIKSCLVPILNTDIDNEIVQYVKEMKALDDFDEFMDNIMNKDNKEHARNYEKLKSYLFNTGAKKKQGRTNVKQNAVTEHFPRLVPSKNINQKTPTNYRTPDNKKDSPSTPGSSGGKGKKTKYVDIKSHESTIALKKGRHPCDCEAKTHSLINNCIKCGRIVCEQEGSGPCFFCDNMVCTNKEMSILDSNSKQSDRLYNQLLEQKTSKEWKKAVEMRDKLLQADRSGDYKRAIYDDQGDYYEGNKWKSKDDSVKMPIHKTRRDLKMALDFATREFVIEEDSEFKKHKSELMKGVNKLLDTTNERFPKSFCEDTSLEELSSLNDSETTYEVNKIKVANESFLAEIDRGLCLSMHQPWATLLVAGIKLHEGRNWYSNHRGRLWIHAASKEPQNNEILEVENMYREIYKDPDFVFPKKYPTRCLIGCVFVEDCLRQETYQKLYPEGESSSPYVLICNNPVILPVFFPMQGQHKIFSLTKEVHKKAKDGILAAKWL